MAKSKLTGSASLPLRLSAFGALYSLLSASFLPSVAIALTFVAVILLAKL